MFGFFKKKPKSEDSWSIAQSEEKGFPIVIRLRESIPQDVSTDSYSTLVNIYWKYESDSGMPQETVNQDQCVFENALDSLDSKDFGFLMLVITGNNRKEWIWYTHDVSKWLDEFNRLLSGHSVYPIEIETNQDPRWSTYVDIRSTTVGA